MSGIRIVLLLIVPPIALEVDGRGREQLRVKSPVFVIFTHLKWTGVGANSFRKVGVSQSGQTVTGGSSKPRQNSNLVLQRSQW